MWPQYVTKIVKLRDFSLMPNVVQTVYLLIIGKIRNCVVCNV